jgi:hypothetical protein
MVVYRHSYKGFAPMGKQASRGSALNRVTCPQPQIYPKFQQPKYRYSYHLNYYPIGVKPL